MSSKATHCAYPTSEEVASINSGMTCREWWAAAALKGFLANPESVGLSYEQHAKAAFDMADAMIAESQKGDSR